LFPLAPPEEVWATYEWIYPETTSEFKSEDMERRFVQANIDEVSGKSEEVLQTYRALQRTGCEERR
jgi:hypothetical protein